MKMLCNAVAAGRRRFSRFGVLLAAVIAVAGAFRTSAAEDALRRIPGGTRFLSVWNLERIGQSPVTAALKKQYPHLNAALRDFDAAFGISNGAPGRRAVVFEGGPVEGAFIIDPAVGEAAFAQTARRRAGFREVRNGSGSWYSLPIAGERLYFHYDSPELLIAAKAKNGGIPDFGKAAAAAPMLPDGLPETAMVRFAGSPVGRLRKTGIFNQAKRIYGWGDLAGGGNLTLDVRADFNSAREAEDALRRFSGMLMLGSLCFSENPELGSDFLQAIRCSRGDRQLHCRISVSEALGRRLYAYLTAHPEILDLLCPGYAGSRPAAGQGRF